MTTKVSVTQAIPFLGKKKSELLLLAPNSVGDFAVQSFLNPLQVVEGELVNSHELGTQNLFFHPSCHSLQKQQQQTPVSSGTSEWDSPRTPLPNPGNSTSSYQEIENKRLR